MIDKSNIMVEKVSNGFVVYVNEYERDTVAKVFVDVSDVIAYVTNVIQTGQR